ncbi:apolipoprotein A-IV-like isoform X1 [Labeo rohita]|nr:apolipoprotein A-IV-like isoform X1 [Labeo rohita]
METQYHCAHIHTHIYIYRLSSLKLTGLSNTSWGLKQTTLNMKLYLILAFVAFTGWQANLSNAEDPNPHLKHLINAFWNYIAQASQPGQEVRLTETLQSEDQMTKITKEAEVLRKRLEKDLNIIKDKLEPYADNLKSQIQERMEELRTAMAPYADSLDSETLKATLLQKSEELQGNLEQSVKELQAQLEPYTADIKEKVDQYLKEMQKSFASSPEDLQANN